MATKLPPNPVGVPPGSSYWNDWYEKLRTLVDEITASTGTGNIVRANNASINNPTIFTPTFGGPITINGSPALTATLALAKITGAGTDGSAAFSDGLLIAYTAPT